MSRSVNVCTFSGYLAADPNVHEFENGDKVANLRLAVNNTKKVDGEFVDDALFLDVKAFGGMVDAIGAYLVKGSFVIVSGRLAQPREWTDKDGGTRFTMVVDHAAVTFGPKTDGAAAQPARQQQKAAQEFERGPVDDDDIPF